MKQYIVDAFTKQVFRGNQAAVCVMDKWISEDLMMSITRENNLSETAFAVKEGKKYHLRWFTPGGEIDLCGHATLGTAYVIMNFYEPNTKEVIFDTMSGDLIVSKKEDLLQMVFPAYDLKKIDVTYDMEQAIGCKPVEAYMARDMLCVMPEGFDIKKASVNLEKVKQLDGLLLHITSKDTEYDCISRSFAPKLNVNEDPVCGSGHCHIVPYWVKKLSKNKLICYQASVRGGVLYCEQQEDKIYMSGNVALYSTCELNI